MIDSRMGYRLMLGLDTVESVAHVIRIALTPVFLLSGIASLLGVLSTRLARVADRVDALAEQLEGNEPVNRRKLQRRLTYLRRRSHVLDAAVMMGTLGGVATSCAGLLLFVGTLRDQPGASLFVAFGLALLFTMGALVAFLIEMLLASRGLRDQADYANKIGEMHELEAGEVGEPSHGDSG
jgi:cytochrome c biogenesis protein CcdA